MQALMLTPSSEDGTKSPSLELCSSCSGTLIRDSEKGEVLCEKCGIVIDPSSEITVGSFDTPSAKSQGSSSVPSSISIPDYGLSTEIAGDNKDSRGKYLGQLGRESARSMQKWQHRIRVSAPGERRLSSTLSKIREMSDSLNLSYSIRDEASLIFRRSMKSSMTSGRKSISGIAIASLYMACRKLGVNRSLKEMALSLGMDEHTAGKYYRFLASEEDGPYVPPPGVQKHISKLVNNEKISPRVERLALELANKTNDNEISGGKMPAGLAAAYVYMASVLLGENLPQKEIAKSAGVTEVTLRNRCREILEKFVIRQKLAAVS